MKKVIYKRWDGTQEPFSLKRKDIVDKFMENIIHLSMDFSETLPLELPKSFYSKVFQVYTLTILHLG